MSNKKERFICEKCGDKGRSKNKKRKYCDDCTRKMVNSKIIKEQGDTIITHA